MPLNIDIQQILLHLLNFVILFAALYFLLYKPVREFMQKREDHYREMDEQARENLAASEQAKAAYEEKLKKAGNEIAVMREQARRDAAKERADKAQKTAEEADAILAKARADAGAEHDRILADAQKEIAEIVMEATAKVVNSPDVADSYDQFLDAVEEVGK